jgi:hypothetical protein
MNYKNLTAKLEEMAPKIEFEDLKMMAGNYLTALKALEKRMMTQDEFGARKWPSSLATALVCKAS